MELIHVPAVPKEAFNKHRRLSDLIKAQIGHLKHVEDKLPEAVRATLPDHQIVTENDAARYIAAMTSVLRLGSAIAAAPAKRVSEMKSSTAARPRERLALAAAGEEARPTAKDGNAASSKKPRHTPKDRGPSSKRQK